MNSKIEICNQALDTIGSRATVADFAEGSPEADACAAHYDAALGNVLQAAHWNFARAQVAMTLIGDATKTPADPVPVPWVYEYAYPADAVQARYLMPTLAAVPGYIVGQTAIGPPVRFLISSDRDSQGNRIKVILSNQPQAILVYTARVTEVSLFDDQFADALVNYLGARICMRLSGDRNRRDEAWKLADAICRAAQASNGNEGLTIIDSMPDWIRTRGYETDWAAPDGGMFWNPPQNLIPIA